MRNRYQLYFTGRVLDYIIEPVPIDIPQESQNESVVGDKRVTQVACGRAHSVFLTSTGGNCTHFLISCIYLSKSTGIYNVQSTNIKSVVTQNAKLL